MNKNELKKFAIQSVVSESEQQSNHLIGGFLGGLARATTAKIGRRLNTLNDAIESFSKETGAWIEPEGVVDGGPFDTCNLSVWNEIARLVDIDYIEATPVLRLSNEEMGIMSGVIPVDQINNADIQRNLGIISKLLGSEVKTDLDEVSRQRMIIIEKIADAMDEVPDGYMIRHERAGAASLKAFAGLGVLDDMNPEVRINNDLSYGAGWIRLGNRRMIDVCDSRFMMAQSENKEGHDAIFVARPWQKAGRWIYGEDIHRQNSVIEGRGCYPAEWRVFIKGGKVTGVSNYYAWAGQCDALSASKALEAVALAEKMLGIMNEYGLEPRFYKAEMVRANPHTRKSMAEYEGVSCTLDFMETVDGMRFLEGGPAFYPFGGGFPCAFAGDLRCEGVALCLMDGVDLMNPKTWRKSEADLVIDRKNHILSFEEARALANSNMDLNFS